MPDAAPYEGLGVFYLGREVDPETADVTDVPVLYDSADLTTHAFIVGMTGSGKTGLGVSLIEEAALDKIPVIAIDPKGDLGNLALQFPGLGASDFRPWIDEGQATRDGVTPDALAARTAAMWADGLAAWGQPAERIGRLGDAADVTLYTPGSDAGVQLSVLGSLTPPTDSPESEGWRDKVQSTVSGLLTLIEVDADPINSAAHVFLSTLLDDHWRTSGALSVEDLIRAIQAPSFDTIGVLDLDTYFPPRERTGLMMKLNGLVASPGYSAWAIGQPLDADRLFFGVDGAPQIAVLSIAHLDDGERMFFVTRLLGEVLAWMRRQSGTGSLRAILYMDEIFGYLPPSANPPTKKLLLTLLKQARAFGLGIVLATQNPVDMDYKALSNCGTWFVGRLQTERDKERLLDGLEGATQATGFDRAQVDRMLSGIGKRRFLLHNVHEKSPTLMATRWVLSYLAGPLTRTQIATLMADRKAASTPPAVAPAPTTPAVARAAADASPETQDTPPAVDVPQVFLDGEPVDEYVPMLLARAEVPYQRKRLGLDHTERFTVLIEMAEGGPQWDAADPLPDRPATRSTPAAGASFAPVPDGLDAGRFATWERDLKRWLQQERPLRVFQSPERQATSAPGEDERAFRIRLGQLAREARDAQKEKLRERYASKLRQLEKRMESAQNAVDREASQASQRKTDTLVRVGTTLLGAFLGGRSRRSTLSQIGVTARSAGRMSKESSDVARAEQKLDALQADYADLDAQLQREMDEIDLAAGPEAAPLETVEITATQTSMHVAELALAWVPFRRDADGRLARA